MVKVKTIIINKNGSLKETSSTIHNIDDLYKKCNFNNDNDFDYRHTWKLDDGHNISLFSKNDGVANTENKYDLPPPLDNKLYFGNMLLLKHSNINNDELNLDNLLDLKLNEWNVLYDKLFGGFEDLNDTEDDEDNEEDSIPEHMKTNEGYLKDDFVVDDNDIEYENVENGETSEEEYLSCTDTDINSDEFSEYTDEEEENGIEEDGVEEDITDEGSTEEGSTEEGSTEEGSSEEGSTEEGSTEEGSAEEASAGENNND